MNNGIIYNPEKFKAMIHYIISQYEFSNKVVLFKLLYFSDFDSYELYEKSISGETYIRKRMEPVPSHFSSAIKELVNEGKIDEHTEVVINYPKYEYSSLKEPDINLLSARDLQVITDNINRFSHFSSKEIGEYSQGDIPWRLADEGEPLNYESVFYRDPEYSVRDYDKDN